MQSPEVLSVLSEAAGRRPLAEVADQVGLAWDPDGEYRVQLSLVAFVALHPQQDRRFLLGAEGGPGRQMPYDRADCEKSQYPQQGYSQLSPD